MVSIYRFPEPDLIRRALTLANEHPTEVCCNEETPTIEVDDETKIKTLYADTVVVGRSATYTTETFKDVHEIRCKTFLSLGSIDLDKIKIFADYIVLVNKFNSTGKAELRAAKTFALVGCVVTGPAGPDDCIIVSKGKLWEHNPIINHVKTIVETLTVTIDGVTQSIGKKVIAREEFHEDPIDASIRAIEAELNKVTD